MKSDEQTLQELREDFARRSDAERPPTIQRPAFSAIAASTPEERDRRLAQREAEQEQAKRLASVSGHKRALIAERGERYADCRLHNFRCDVASQRTAANKLADFVGRAHGEPKSGEGVFLFGPCGTGKDHLAMGAAMGWIHNTGLAAKWLSGAMLFEKLRDSFDGRKTEGEVMGEYQRVPLLWISDPLPVRGELTQYQAEALYRLIDVRYSHKRPVIVTANIEPGKADESLGPAIARRLRESTLQIHTNWPSYRKHPA